jgi:hypothetical protein
MKTEPAKESCPLCLALPCDWGTDPHKATDALFLATADLRIKTGVGEKPMLSDLPQVIGDRLNEAAQIISALRCFAGKQPGALVEGRRITEWTNDAEKWLKVIPK